jgi:hypothetical protein
MNTLEIATEGYWSAEKTSVATNGYWTVDLIIADSRRTIRKHKIPYYGSEETVTLKLIGLKDEQELLMVIKSFLICLS